MQTTQASTSITPSSLFSSTASALTGTPSTKSSSIPQSRSSPAPQLVNADTALVIEPIQKTVLTQINPAITFQNPKGEPIASQGAETILITSYFTPTPVPAASSSATADSSIIPSLAPISSQVASSSQSSTPLAMSAISSTLPQSSQAVAESGSINITSIPSFTYSPQQGGSSVSLETPTPIITSKAATSNSTGMPGFNHPGPGSRSAQSTNTPRSSAVVENPSRIQTPVQASSSAAPISSSLSTPSGSSSINSPKDSIRPTTALDATGSKSRVVVTKTLYTTVYPSSAAAQQPSPAPSKIPELGGESSPTQSSVSSAKAPMAPSPAPLAPPPVVIVTQYTTFTPSPTVQPSQVPETPNTSIAQRPSSSSIPAPSSSAVVLPSSPPAQPSPSSTSVQNPTSPFSSAISTPQSSTAPVAQLPPSPSAAPPAVSSTTSDVPLVITPIAPSQIFTVTVTTTQKETVTETATVSVTVRA